MSTDRYAVFGNPIAHSKSPQIHLAFAQQTQQDMRYDKKLIAAETFEQEVEAFFAAGGKGLNITLPFKQRAFAMADVLSERAQSAGAVNTLYMHGNKLYGDNTDGVGLLADLRDCLQWPIKQQRILILGAGGAVRGVLLPLLAEQPQTIVLANRNLNKAQTLVELFSGLQANRGTSLVACALDRLSAQGAFDLIISAIPLDTEATMPFLGSGICHSDTACYDMFYADQGTAFLRWAQQHQLVRLADGLGMLIEQAAEAFYLWRQVRPITSMVHRQLR